MSLIGVGLLLGFSFGNPASAAPTYDYLDIDLIFETATLADPVSGTLDITTNDGDCFLGVCDTGVFQPDGDPNTQQIESAVISFLLFDSQYGRHDLATIDLGVDPLGPAPLSPLQNSVVVGSEDRFLFVLYLEHIQAETNVLLQLSNTGMIDWEVAPVAGNPSVLVKIAALEASETAAPEPNAALLFCLGFGVIGTATRRHRTP